MTAKKSQTTSRVELGGIYGELDDLYDSLYQQLDAPQWAGKNLDGLFDILTTELKQKTLIVWKGYDQVLDRYFTDNQKVATVISEAAKDSPDLDLELQIAHSKELPTS